MHLHRRPPWPAASSIIWPSTPVFRTKLKKRLMASSETVSPTFLTGQICPISKRFIERCSDLAHPYRWAFHIDLLKTIISRDILFPKASNSYSNRSTNVYVFLHLTIIGTIVFPNIWQIYLNINSFISENWRELQGPWPMRKMYTLILLSSNLKDFLMKMANSRTKTGYWRLDSGGGTFLLSPT